MCNIFPDRFTNVQMFEECQKSIYIPESILLKMEAIRDGKITDKEEILNIAVNFFILFILNEEDDNQKRYY